MNARSAAVCLLVGALAVAACKSDPAPAPSIYPELDFKPGDPEAKFDQNNVLDIATFTDPDAVDAAKLSAFLQKTPYAQPSFLGTYQSNGTRVADAIVRAAHASLINPIVLLTFAETEAALVAERDYPSSPSRTEYAFNCGCYGDGKCAPELAGFDRQIECVAGLLRGALQQIGATGATASGFATKKSARTLDGVTVAPADDATAALYDRTPRVAEGSAGGTWFFWNVYHLYAKALGYKGPADATNGTAWVGEACTVRENCGFQGATCATNYPGGACTATCTDTCPSRADKPETFCAAFPDGGFCLPVCDSGVVCRDGYKCVSRLHFGPGPAVGRQVCLPASFDQ